MGEKAWGRQWKYCGRNAYLLYGVEDSSFSGIVAYAGVVLPVAPIIAEVVVGEETFVL